MPYITVEINELEKGTELVGDGSCVSLIKAKALGLIGKPTSCWREGAKVVGSKGLARGTAIATFVNGKYPNKRSGNHAAFFLAYAGNAIWVVDQWPNDPAHPGVAKRVIHAGLRNPDGSYRNPSNAAGAFSVIELASSCAD